jgi:hypothetical protein
MEYPSGKEMIELATVLRRYPGIRLRILDGAEEVA